MTLRDIDVDIILDIDKDPLEKFNEEINETLQLLRQIDDDSINNLTNEFRRMRREVDDTTGEIRRFDREIENLSDAHVDFNIEEAQAHIERLKAQIESLDRENVNVDLDIRRASSELARLYTQIKLMESEDINIDVDIKGALSELAILRTQLNAFNMADNVSSGIDLNVGGLAKVVGALILLPTIVPVISVLIGVVGSLGAVLGVVAGGFAGIASAAGIAGFGLLGFSSLATSTISGLYEKNAKLTSEQKQLKKTTDTLIGSWNDLKKSLSNEIFDVASNGVKSLSKLLDMSEPILENVGDSVSKLIDNFNKSLKTDDVKGIFRYLEQSVSPLTESIGNGLGNALKGVGNTIVALGPLTSWMADGFENMMVKFEDWTTGLKDSEGMKSFISYVKENLPKLGSILGNASIGVTDFFTAFGGTASDGLDWFQGEMKDFSKWASGLGGNKEFQNFLKDVKTEAPLVIDALKEIGKFLGNIFKLFDDKGQMLESVTNMFKGINKFMTSDFGSGLLNTMFMPQNTVDMKKGEVPQTTMSYLVSKAFSSVKLPELKFPKFSWPSLPKISWPSFNLPKLSWPSLPSFKWPSLPSFRWPGIPSFHWPGLPKFNWPSLPKFSWPSLPRFHWPTLPRFSWPSFPKFNWPSLPKLSVSLPNWLNGSHANGLGRVPFDGYTAELHRNEAVLTAQQADTLRSAGMLQGDGTFPTLDMNAIGSYAPLADTGSTTTNNSSTSQSIIIKAPVTIHVEGGKDSETTAKNVKDQLEDWFADLQDIFPAVLEG